MHVYISLRALLVKQIHGLFVAFRILANTTKSYRPTKGESRFVNTSNHYQHETGGTGARTTSPRKGTPTRGT